MFILFLIPKSAMLISAINEYYFWEQDQNQQPPRGGQAEPESGWSQILNSNPELRAVVNACER